MKPAPSRVKPASLPHGGKARSAKGSGSYETH
jgi:hypothetical protein